jgi:hypothetical protein
MTVVSLYIYQVLLFVKKHNNLINFDTPQHDYNTRNKNLQRPVRHDSAFYEKSVSYMGIKLTQKLALDIRMLPFKQFKQKLKTYFISNPFYSVNEFVEIDVRM